jgi:hypothetical protein
MKLTWFGGTTMRIHIGGKILVLDADGAPAGIDRTELVSGADIVLALAGLADIDAVEPASWTPRKAGALIDEVEAPEVLVHRLGPSLVVDAVGERPLLLATHEVERMGRWTWGAVVVVVGAPEALPDIAANVLERLGPKLIAVAGPDTAVDQVILRIQNRLDGTGFMALEAGLALEV